MKRLALVALFGSLISFNAVAEGFTPPKNQEKQDASLPLYIGFLTGYGHTTWGELVSPEDNWFVTQSTPIHAKDSGLIWGFLAGWQISPHFALESTFVKYRDAVVDFLQYSFYTPVNEIRTSTDAFTVVGKFIVPIEGYGIKPYADAGIAVTYRSDIMKKSSRVGAAFGIGVMKDLSDRFTLDLSAQYVTGYAMAELKPAQDYIPFLLSAQARLLYRFSLA